METFKKVRFWRRVYISFSIFLGLFSPLYCWYMFPSFNPFLDPLSKFGIQEETWMMWDLTLFMLSIAIFLNSKHAIKYRFKNRVTIFSLRSLVFISSISLILVAVISIDVNEDLHYWLAFLYFAVYNFYVFIFGLIRMYKDIRKGFFSVVMGSLMLLSTLLLIPFQGMGIFEITYASLVMFWNLVIFIKRIKRVG